MKTKLNTKTIVAAVASVIGLAVYGYTSMVGYLAASATSTLPVVLTVRCKHLPHGSQAMHDREHREDCCADDSRPAGL